MKKWSDVYSLPLEMDRCCSWVFDSGRNFVFQFLTDNEDACKLMLSAINGDRNLMNKELSFAHDEGFISTNDGLKVILIRGWGNLTGTGAMNLPYDEAANIQDTFAEFIVERLNDRSVK